VTLDGERSPGDVLVTRLNALAGAQGVGRIDHVENRLVGIKSARSTRRRPRSFAPHRPHGSGDADPGAGRLPPQAAVSATSGPGSSTTASGLASCAVPSLRFVAVTQEPVSGEVRLRLWRGTVSVAGGARPGSLYREELATYDRRPGYL